MTAESSVRPAREASKVELEEILAQVRRDLRRRDEAPGGDWVGEAATELRAGTKLGFFVPGGSVLAFYARRGAMAFGHLHAEATPGAVDRGAAVADRLIASLPDEVASVDLGFTGLTEADEAVLVDRLAGRPGSRVIRRQAMERTLGPDDTNHPAEPPGGLRRHAVGDVTLAALGELDMRAFAGSVDALLLGPLPDDYAQSVNAILESRLGRFLDEASCAVIETDPLRLVGTILTAEKSPQRAVFLDIAVDPERRRRGIGRFLLGWGLRALWALGYEQVRLWVSKENRGAVGLYERFGFRPAGTASIYRWDRAASDPQPQRSR